MSKRELVRLEVTDTSESKVSGMRGDRKKDLVIHALDRNKKKTGFFSLSVISDVVTATGFKPLESQTCFIGFRTSFFIQHPSIGVMT